VGSAVLASRERCGEALLVGACSLSTACNRRPAGHCKLSLHEEYAEQVNRESVGFIEPAIVIIES
jgi:hypothetical protein